MTARILVSLVLVILIAFSCSEDDDPKDVISEQEETDSNTVALELDPNFQHCDSVYIATSIGTACCINGPTIAKPGNIFTYHYQMNHRDAKVNWQIFEGDISILAGQDTRTVTVQFGPNFTAGIIIGVGVGIKYEDLPQLCSDRVVIGQN